MDIYVVMAQRKERYEGEYAPEALAVMSEADHDENPAYLADVVADNRASGEFMSVVIMTLRVSGVVVNTALRPAATVLNATLVHVGSRE